MCKCVVSADVPAGKSRAPQRVLVVCLTRFCEHRAMHSHTTWGWLVAMVGFLLGAACTGSDSAPRAPDDAGTDAALMRDAQAEDAARPAPNDAGRGLDAAMSDAGIDAGGWDAGKARDSGVHHEDAGLQRDAALPQDAGRDAGKVPANDDDAGSEEPGPISEDTFSMRVVASGLDAPWEITWGPDDRLWITERAGWRVIRMNPATGSYSVVLDVLDVFQVSGQDGVLGMALHPQLGASQGSAFVYLAYTYDADASDQEDRRVKIVRFTYDMALATLGSPVSLIEGLPGSGDHNSGRLVFGPDAHLYYTIGDQGHNQFSNKCLRVRSQDLPTQSEVDDRDWSTYQGKILRLGLDGSIPSDNPTLAGVRSHIFSYGHRNAQGLVFGPNGKLYSSEQGPKTDDELNLIVAGKNYGWPHVAGYRDDNAYIYADWSASTPESCDSLNYSDYDVPDSVPKHAESSWSHADYVTPLRTFYTVDNEFDFLNLPCEEPYFVCWPTIAPSSLDIYVPGDTGLRTWGTALLVPNLKGGSVLRVKLSADGESTEGEAKELFKTTNRYRDLAIASDKRTFYVVTDSNGATSGPTSGSTLQLDHRGAVLEFTYTPKL